MPKHRLPEVPGAAETWPWEGVSIFNTPLKVELQPPSAMFTSTAVCVHVGLQGGVLEPKVAREFGQAIVAAADEAEAS